VFFEVCGSSCEPHSFATFAALSLFEWDFDLEVTAGRGGIHGLGYFAYVTLRDTPLGIAKHPYRHGSAPQVLLARNILVRSNQNLKPGFFGSVKQLAIYQPVPAHVLCSRDGVACEKLNKRGRCAVVKQYAH
jgi:hypothetical protein